MKVEGGGVEPLGLWLWLWLCGFGLFGGHSTRKRRGCECCECCEREEKEREEDVEAHTLPHTQRRETETEMSVVGNGNGNGNKYGGSEEVVWRLTESARRGQAHAASLLRLYKAVMRGRPSPARAKAFLRARKGVAGAYAEFADAEAEEEAAGEGFDDVVGGGEGEGEVVGLTLALAGLELLHAVEEVEWGVELDGVGDEGLAGLAGELECVLVAYYELSEQMKKAERVGSGGGVDGGEEVVDLMEAARALYAGVEEDGVDGVDGVDDDDDDDEGGLGGSSYVFQWLPDTVFGDASDVLRPASRPEDALLVFARPEEVGELARWESDLQETIAEIVVTAKLGEELMRELEEGDPEGREWRRGVRAAHSVFGYGGRVAPLVIGVEDGRR